MKEYCDWKSIEVLASVEVDRVNFNKPWYIFVYTYLFTLRLGKEIDPIILELYLNYQVCSAQVGPAIWHMLACIRYLYAQTQENLTFAHLIHLYALKIFRGGVIKLRKCGHNAIITNVDDGNDHGWMKIFVVVALRDILTASASPIPEAWNYNCKFSLVSRPCVILKVFSLSPNLSFLLF